MPSSSKNNIVDDTCQVSRTNQRREDAEEEKKNQQRQNEANERKKAHTDGKSALRKTQCTASFCCI